LEPDRRTLIASAAALMAPPTLARAADGSRSEGVFPKGFLWGAATAGHQIEGNNTNSDGWLLENVKPTLFREPSLDAANSFELWPTDLDLVKSLGLNTYRFSLEWARIEPEPGKFSIAMLDHYKAMIEGCRARGLVPMVTFNHFTTPRWFAELGAWTYEKSSELFARFCDRATRHLGEKIGYATTLNEPNLSLLLAATQPELMTLSAPMLRAMVAAAAKACGSERFQSANLLDSETARIALPNMIAAHKAGRAAIKSIRPDLPVGVSLAMTDDQDGGSAAKRDQVRADAYGAWLEATKGDDFIGVQNYARYRWDTKRAKPPPPGARLDDRGQEVYPASLAGAVRYAHKVSGCPVMVTEHGVSAKDDTLRAWLIPAALKDLKATMDDGVPVLGYIHWSLIDNYEWIFGYEPKFGLCAFDRTTFKRTPKPSAYVLGAIARRNRL
jgi:beta-glucosidase